MQDIKQFHQKIIAIFENQIYIEIKFVKTIWVLEGF